MGVAIAICPGAACDTSKVLCMCINEQPQVMVLTCNSAVARKVATFDRTLLSSQEVVFMQTAHKHSSDLEHEALS